MRRLQLHFWVSEASISVDYAELTLNCWTQVVRLERSSAYGTLCAWSCAEELECSTKRKPSMEILDYNAYSSASLGISCFECLSAPITSLERNTGVEFRRILLLLLLSTNGHNLRHSVGIEWYWIERDFASNLKGWLRYCDDFFRCEPLSRSPAMIAGKYCRWYTVYSWYVT